ncbi:MAG: CPBP family intramembrane glutamic endopeptidase [Candidatus Odinarchaeota archaeon]
MNNREIPESEESKKESVNDTKRWSFCPVCGNILPEVKNLKFCIKCGMNLQYLKEHKYIQANKVQNPYITPTLSPQSYKPPIKYGPKKISDEEVFDTKELKLWSTLSSFGIPLLAFVIINIATAAIIIIILFFSFRIEFLYDFLSNPYFIIFTLFIELIFILIPVLYVGQYLQNPTLKNRLGLLGFTREGFDKVGLIQEILIGIGFAIIGIVLVLGSSFITEIFLESAFNVTFSDASTETDLLFSSTNLLIIIIFSILMILVIGPSEEILFRGFMQKGLTRNLGNRGGILLTAFIFAIIHVLGIISIYLNSPLYLLILFIYSFIPYFVISLLLGLIYYWRNENLIAVIITHGVYDTLTIILAYLLPQIF